MTSATSAMTPSCSQTAGIDQPPVPGGTNDDVGEIEHDAERRDEQAAARRHEQRRRRDDQDVERREGRAAAVRDVDDRGDEQRGRRTPAGRGTSARARFR